MDTFNNYKNRALASLRGSWDKAAIATLIAYAIYYVVYLGVQQILGERVGTVVSVVWALACIPLMWGLGVLFLDKVRGKDIENAALFDGYKDFKRIFCTILLSGIYQFLWSLLLIVPGIIKAISYSQVSFILKDDSTISNNAAIEKSMRMMDGHKMDYFLLELSFIGWVILAVLTMGLGFLLLYPYMQTTLAHFYEDLKAETGE